MNATTNVVKDAAVLLIGRYFDLMSEVEVKCRIMVPAPVEKRLNKQLWRYGGMPQAKKITPHFIKILLFWSYAAQTAGDALKNLL